MSAAYAILYDHPEAGVPFWGVTSNRRKAMRLARMHGQSVIYRRTVEGGGDARWGWDYATWVKCSTPLKVELTSWRVEVHYPDGTYGTIVKGVTWNAAQSYARDECRQYTYSNGGARCGRYDSKMYVLGINIPGPRAHVRIIREEAT
jgi:hypothetical protein